MCAARASTTPRTTCRLGCTRSQPATGRTGVSGCGVPDPVHTKTNPPSSETGWAGTPIRPDGVSGPRSGMTVHRPLAPSNTQPW